MEKSIPIVLFTISNKRIIGAALFGMFAPVKGKFGLKWVMGVGLSSHLIAYILCFLFLPFDSPLRNTWDKGIIEPR